jgi:DNA polymerase I
MEFQILDIDYVLVDERPIIRIFGNTEEGKTVCGFFENFAPYFYVNGGEEILKSDHNVAKVEKVKRNIIGGNGEEIYKVTTKNPSKTPELRDKLFNAGLVVYEADILYKYRFMNDLGLGGRDWVSAECVSTATNTVHAESKIQLNKVKTIQKDNDAPLKYLAFDIECIPLKPGNMPEAKKDPVILISMVFSEPFKGKDSVVLGTRPGGGVSSFATENEMLEEFKKIIIEYDADILTGYNVNNFDFPYILERMRQTNVKPIFGRCTQKHVMARKIGPRFKISIVGRVIVDSFELVKKDFSLQRYGLDFVSRTLLKKEKVNVKHSEIEKLWRGGMEDFLKLVEYCKIDSVLALDLVLKLNLMDKYIALSSISGTLLQDTLEGGETGRIENFLLREFNKKGYVFPCRPPQSTVSEREKRKKQELVGGYVIEPEKSLHSNVVVLDFKSMYPSIIRTFNICPTTLVKDGENDFIETPNGAKFLPIEKRRGIIPKILEELMKKRASAKRKLEKAETPNKKRVLYAQQWAMKIMANAFYGHMGYSRARIYDIAIANAITSCGRNIIKNTVDTIKNKYGYNVVYGDTDSVFVKIDNENMEELNKEGNEIASYITKQLPGIMELENEKIFKRFLPLTKKRYVAWKFSPIEKDGKLEWEEGMEMKGIETVRRDWCNLVSDALGNVIEIILKKEDVKDAVRYFKSVIEDLVSGKIPIQKLVITKTMTKSTRSYVGMQPHIELVKKIQTRSPGEAPGIGDRIEYVIVKGTSLLSKRAEDPTYITENGLQVDPRYYIENQLLPPLERIFAGLGISKSELLGNGRQIGLLEAMRNGHHKKEEVKEIPIGLVNGFICNKCNKFYQRIPLIGSCDCGGKVLFSSEKGPVEFVVN